jgi:hypothetical protein
MCSGNCDFVSGRRHEMEAFGKHTYFKAALAVANIFEED